MLLEDEYPDTMINLCNVSLQNSIDFKYIRSYISQNKANIEDIETDHRIQMTYAKFAAMTNLLWNSKIHLKARPKSLFFRRFSLVLTKFSFKEEIWALGNYSMKLWDIPDIS